MAGAPATPRRRRLVWGVVVVGVLALVTAVQVLPPPSQLGSRFATNVGDPVLLMWQMDVQSHHLGMPLQGNIFFPHADVLAYSDPLIAYLPVFRLVLAITGDNPIAAYNAVAFTLYLGGALAVYALAQHLLGRGDAALIAALLFSLAPYRSAAVSHVQLAGFLFVPLTLLLVMRYLERRRLRDAVLAGLCAGATWLGTLYGAVMLAVAVAGFLAVWLVQHRRELEARLLVGAGAALGAAAVLVGPTLPAYLRVQRSGVIDRAASGLVTAKPDSFTHLPPSPLYRAAGGSSAQLADLQALYPGTVLLVLAGLAVLVALDRFGAARRRTPAARIDGAAGTYAARRRDYALPLAAAAAICLAVMVGPNRTALISEPDRVMRRLVPGMGDLRDLTRFWLVPLLILSLLAGLGALELLRRAGARSRAAIAAGVLLIAGLELAYRQEFAAVSLDGPRTAANHALAALPSGAVMELPLPPVDTFPYDFTVNPRQLRSTIDGDPRVEGYSGAIPTDVRATIEDARRLPDPGALLRLRLWGVRYLVLHAGAQACAGEYAPAELATMRAALEAQRDSVARVDPAGSDLIVELIPAAAGLQAPPAPASTAPDRGAPLCDLG